MDVERLRQSPIGKLVEITGVDPRTMRDYAYKAFVPEPLPTQPALTHATWNAASDAAGALGRLKQVCAHLPNPQLLIAPALAKEAQATSALEGTYGALPDVLEARLPGFEPRTPEIKEINAYERMATLAFDWISDREIALTMLADLQGILARASRRPSLDPGKIREHQVIIGPEDCAIEDARFIPPPPDDRLRSGLDAWEAWVRKDHDLPVVIRAALAHYQFETLHPFGDCNGRVGRLVVVLQLLRAGALDEPSLTISPWLLRRRDQYQEHLLTTSTSGDWNPWVRFFARGVTEQALSHVEVAKQLLDWAADVRGQLLERHWTGTIASVAENLIEWPVVTNTLLQQRFGVTAPTGQSAIDRLVDLGVLSEMTGKTYGRIYGASHVISLVESL